MTAAIVGGVLFTVAPHLLVTPALNAAGFSANGVVSGPFPMPHFFHIYSHHPRINPRHCIPDYYLVIALLCPDTSLPKLDTKLRTQTKTKYKLPFYRIDSSWRSEQYW